MIRISHIAKSAFILLVVCEACIGAPVERTVFNHYEMEHGIPRDLLYAISLQESGRTVNGKRVVWPWTLNIGGDAYYFDTMKGAYDRAQLEVRNGRKYQLGVGVGQHEWRFQKGRFRDLQDALDPERNVEEQAKLLHEFYRKSGSWVGAIALYHVGNISSDKRIKWAVAYVQKIQRYHYSLLSDH